MSKRGSLEQTLCLKYCAYYKPGKNEELACRGYAVVERFIREGKGIVFEDFSCMLDPGVAAQLVQKMCMTCDFYARDCDYIQDRSARPCGGFVLVGQLLGAGVITIEDIG